MTSYSGWICDNCHFPNEAKHTREPDDFQLLAGTSRVKSVPISHFEIRHSLLSLAFCNMVVSCILERFRCYILYESTLCVLNVLFVFGNIPNTEIMHVVDTHSPWASYQIRKIEGCACAGKAGNVFPATHFKGNRKLAIPACIAALAWRTCRDACRDR